MTTQAKPGTFDIATRTETGRETRKGYIQGGFATHREPGKYFWTFTHLATGLACNSGVCADTKAKALEALAELAVKGLPLYAVRVLDGKGWGGK